MTSPPCPGPMLARQVDALPWPDSQAMRFEPKWDGFRTIVAIDADHHVQLLSRHGKPLAAIFPEIAAAAGQQLPADTILDGETVCWTASGRLDFGALQARNAHPAPEVLQEHPAQLIAFDVLRHQRTDTTGWPLAARRYLLEEMLSAVPADSPLVLGMHTDDVTIAVEWLSGLVPVGVEGIMVKPAASTYRPGDRSSWTKVKHYHSAEAIVGGVTGSLAHPDELLLGRYVRPDDTFRIVGRTLPLPVQDANAVAARLSPARTQHPWPDRPPRNWLREQRISRYIKVEPLLVVEVRVDLGSYAGQWRHSLPLLRIRTDLEPADVPHDLETAG